MGDMALTRKSWMVEKDYEVSKKELQILIQERVSRISRLKQDIEDLVKGVILTKEADILMLEKELRLLTEKLNSLNPNNFNAVDIIEVNVE
jgi:uncharacterized coiled-coil protein SlyX